MASAAKYLSIFSPATEQERKENFEDYWEFTQRHGGQLFEDDKDLEKNAPDFNIFKTTLSNCANRLPILKRFIEIMLRCTMIPPPWIA